MDKTMKALLLIFFLSFTLLITIVFFNKPIAQFTRAKEDFLPSASNSLLFAFPLSVKADGKTQSTISVFVRSDKGMPVPDQKITLHISLGTVVESGGTTDAQGKATFHIYSDKPGITQIVTMIGGSLQIAQKLSVKFE